MSARRALITGITGQDGSYLAELLLEKGYEVHGMVRRLSTRELRAPRAPPRPDHAAHRRPARPALAGRRAARRASRTRSTTSPRCRSWPTSWTQPTLTAEFTGVGVTRMLEAMREVVARGPLLPGLLARRCSARCARRRRTRRRRSTRAAPTASPRSTATSSRSTTARATASTPARGSSSTTRSPRRGLEFVTRKITHARGRDQARPGRRAARSATSTPSATGATRRTTSRRCG